MKKKWKKIKKVFCTDIYGEEVETTGARKNLLVVIVAVALICFATAIMNYDNGQNNVCSTALFMAIAFIACGYTGTKKPKRRVMVKRIASLVVGIVFSVYAYEGYTDGFSVTWSVVVPYATMTTMGLLDGAIVSGYLAVLFLVLYLTPLREHLNYQYTDVFCYRFPLLYALCFIVSLYSNYKRQEAQMRASWERKSLKVAVEEERRKVGKITMQTIISISNAVDAKDPYTKKHSVRVAKYSKIIANELRWDKTEQENIYNMALLHDIGKIGVPDAILNKHGELTDEEFPEIRKHPLIGGGILKDFTIISDVSKGAYYHHERYDGKGYPEGLKGEEIPIEARIIGIADAIDAMNSNRVYRGKKDISYILEQLEEGKGTQFDPNLDEIVISLIKNGKLRLDILK